MSSCPFLFSLSLSSLSSSPPPAYLSSSTYAFLCRTLVKSVKSHKNTEATLVGNFQANAAITEKRLTEGIPNYDFGTGRKHTLSVFADPLSPPPSFRYKPVVELPPRRQPKDLSPEEKKLIEQFFRNNIEEYGDKTVSTLFAELRDAHKLPIADHCSQFDSITINGTRFRKASVDQKFSARDSYVSYFWQFQEGGARDDELKDWTDYGQIVTILEYFPFSGLEAKLDELVRGTNHGHAYSYFTKPQYLCIVGVYELKQEDPNSDWISLGELPELKRKTYRAEKHVLQVTTLTQENMAIWQSSAGNHFVVNRQNVILMNRSK
jgi:hypothetical protein